ncbi:hypothetical protein CE52_13650 [Salmonella enterica subsp. enterica serovar Derby]|uniref:Uncharacterized protein n=1 Tax=Vibrio cholerae TaxID=666 RepID=A0A8B5ZL58_VIBCL|nr:hypothetical protein EHQ66_00160 [Proteus mirabilis]EBR1799083.1 hypothetical protein [Salmonella enterica]EBW6709273.1 hypothetical protein [Salmonella enterica subsp. enterica serovar Kentucky]ECR5622869.1 hypothetical protein [Salmonella enterica subsp. enterica serovar Agona]EEB2847316.1 hypothetical protein [Salmonella enterica subsp. enterica serovar Derby]EGR1048477.1 hypothetical protein [Vibrio cholerae]MBF8853061.1 hypothetical protein [Escherichia coli]
MITSIFRKIFRREPKPDLYSQLSNLVAEIRNYQAEIERFHADIEASASHFEHITEPNNFISAEWVNGNLHVKHRH